MNLQTEHQRIIHQRTKWVILTFLKLKSSALQKNMVKRMKRRASDWEKISAKHIPDKGLISKLYEKLLKPNNRKQLKKWAKI